MGRKSGWRTAAVKGAIEVLDPMGQSHLRITHQPSGTNATWHPEKAGRIPRDAECLIETPWGEQVTSATAKDTPIRRKSALREVTLGSRRFVYRHTSDRRSVVERDGLQIAAVHKSWQHVWSGRRPSFRDLGFTMDAPPTLDPFDEAVIVAFAAVIGTPGHEGAFTSICRFVPLLVLEGP
ncbi:hypothetical protein GCM10011492_00270 [Flexivirga endophytica]|uniref:Uncharacterized protein n=1 Tax=Flexivirga endophytica TaxID=1849103 RepID=A0A916WNF4_9MICO|nr:hypothetical protein [Flexivirga endophytica]GGB14578.1 hypothetical protein GCM10011492_00270 [Flexivirga endophytica]GHB65693.1 hypothetical protein GCM10008112_38230 [Flexivirga endophytica]